MQEIDLRVLLAVLRHRLKWIIAAAVATAVLLGTYTYMFVADTYRSSFSMYVRSVTTLHEGEYLTSAGLMASQTLVQEYIALLNTDLVLDEVADVLYSQGYKVSSGAIRNAISMEQFGETALLNVRVTTTNPGLSKAICDAMAELAPIKIKEVMESGKITKTSQASAGVKVGPNVPRSVMIGGLVGFVASYAIFLVVFFADNTVSDERELKRRLNVPVLGSVPSAQTTGKAGK